MQLFCNLSLFVVIIVSSAVAAHVNISLEEEQQIGVPIIDLGKVLNLSTNPTKKTEFKILEQTLHVDRSSGLAPSSRVTDQTGWFKIEKSTGILSQTKRIDRDLLCGKVDLCFIQIIFLPGLYMSVMHLDVYIKDLNDNSPCFPAPSIEINVSEDLEVNHEIRLDRYKAADVDLGNNSMIQYTLLHHDVFFKVRQYRDPVGHEHLSLVVSHILDYEQTKVHRMLLLASDMGTSSQSSFVPLLIHLIDENDNKPNFEKTLYEVYLSENTPTGEILTRVQASDRDSGDLGYVHYVIPASDQDRREGYPPVSVNETTGTVTLCEKLDYHVHNEMKIIIEAIDNDQNRPQKSTTILLLHVRDVNDHKPVLEIQYIVEHKNDTAFISENSPNPSILAHISTSDLDDGENGRVTSTVETFIPGTENTMTESETFVIRDELLRTTIKLDREVRGEYDVIIKACDYGVPPKCARSQQVKIIVLDENEFAPFFLHAKIDIVFPEDTEVGSVIANAMATDRDAENGPAWVLSEYGELEASPNGLVTFEIQLAESDDAIASLPVRIDPTSANLTLARTLDYETRRLWKFVIIGRDGGRPVARESQCVFTLRVRNANDNPPIFVNPNANNSVIFVPIRASSYVFATIKAVDLGVDERTEMRYSYTLVQKDGKIIDRNRYKDLFKLDRFSGKFSLHWFKYSIPDILGSYTAIIKVTDFGTPPLTTSIAVIMKVVRKDTQTDPVVPNSNKVRQVEISSTSSMVLLAAVFGGCGSGFLVIGIAVVICIRRKRNKTANEKGSDAAAPDSPRVSQDCGVENSTTAGVQTFDTKTSDESVAPELPRRSRTHSKTVPKIAVSPTPQVNDGSSSEHIYVMMKPIPPPPLAKQNFKRGQRKTKESAAIKNPVQNLAPRRTPLPITSNASAGVNNLSRMGAQCTEMCKFYGHGDTCWMPATVQSNIPQPCEECQTSSNLGQTNIPQISEGCQTSNRDSGYTGSCLDENGIPSIIV